MNVVGIQSAAQVASSLTAAMATGRILFLLIHTLGVVAFAYIVAKRMVPLCRAERDFRFDHHWLRLGRVLKFWLGQWKQPRYRRLEPFISSSLPASYCWRFARSRC